MIRTGHRPVHPGVALQECTNVLGSLPFLVRTLDFGASELGSVLGKASATLEALRPELRAAFGAMWDREEVKGMRSSQSIRSPTHTLVCFSACEDNKDVISIVLDPK